MLCACKQSTHPKQSKKNVLKKKFKKVICIHTTTTSNYCNLLRRIKKPWSKNISKKNFCIHSHRGNFLLTVGYYYNLKKTEKNSYCNILQLHMYDKYQVLYTSNEKKNISRLPTPHIFFLQIQNKTNLLLYWKRKIAKNLEKIYLSFLWI